MSAKSYRHWSPQDKLRIIEEARKGGLAVSQVCRRNGISPTLFYEWEKKMKDASLSSLKREPSKKPVAKVEELEAEVIRFKAHYAARRPGLV